MKKKFIISAIILMLFSNVSVSYGDEQYSYSTPSNFDKNQIKKEVTNKDQILFIVDFSNSMNERLGHTTKLDAALGTMKDILQELPETTQIGLRVYGHRTGFTPKQSCSASELVVPISSSNAQTIFSRLNSINAVGWTPITYSLKQAAFFDFGDNNNNKRIVLISDGGENCDESPCDFVIELMKYRDDIKIDVIALAVGDEEANNQLKCVALVTSGKFYNANTAAELKKSLEDSLNLQKEVQGLIINK